MGNNSDSSIHPIGCPLSMKSIACTQPRHVATPSVAQRVASEMDVKIGDEVGYLIRFEGVTSRTIISNYITDDSLLREAMSHQDLVQYHTIVLSEVQERVLATVILIGYLRLLAVRRPELKAVIMSSTLDAKAFQIYFQNARQFAIPGRSYPVEIFYIPEPELKNRSED